MDFSTFTRLTQGTAVYPDARSGTLQALTYVSLGLVGEACEVREKQLHGDTAGLRAELGDVAWYLSRLHCELDVLPELKDVYADADQVDLLVCAGRVAEIAKKALRDDHGELTPERKDLFTQACADVARAWVGVCADAGIDPAGVLSANYDKLTSRSDRGVLNGSGDNR